MRKKLMSCVCPGFEDTFARSFLPVIMLISEDFPTFDRPMKANSGKSEEGQDSKSGALVLKIAELIFISLQQGRWRRTKQAVERPCWLF